LALDEELFTFVTQFGEFGDARENVAEDI